MTGDQPIQPSGEPFTWVRCTCGAGLWRQFGDRVEMVISPRGGQRRTISAPIEGASGIKVTCEKCGRTSELGQMSDERGQRINVEDYQPPAKPTVT